MGEGWKIGIKGCKTGEVYAEEIWVEYIWE